MLAPSYRVEIWSPAGWHTRLFLTPDQAAQAIAFALADDPSARVRWWPSQLHKNGTAMRGHHITGGWLDECTSSSCAEDANGTTEP